MVEEVSLRVGIDARSAAAGAESFKRSSAEIIRNAEKMGRVVGKAASDFDKKPRYISMLAESDLPPAGFDP